MTSLFRSKSCGGLPRRKASFFHYSNHHDHNHDHGHGHGQDEEVDDEDVCHYYQDCCFISNNSPITTPFISPCQQGPNQSNNFTVVSLVLAALRKSFLTCSVHDSDDDDGSANLDIGCPTDVRHESHVTFDRFNGFLGLPIAFQNDVPRKVPSASTCVFGVSVESMQCSYDESGNSVPTILLMMQNHLYSGGGLQAEGIFRVNGEKYQEEDVRNQLNKGIVPHGVDVHCLAGLIKAWFRELPTGVLDSLTRDQVMHCNTEEECTQLTKSLPPTEAALLDWAINLMGDVVMYDQINKMNPRNIAMVFAPNMTKMADPLTALLHAVQIMNLLKTLVIKNIREREESSTAFDPLCLYMDSPSPVTKLETTLKRLESENEKQFWRFPRKSESGLEYAYISGKNSLVTCRNYREESNSLSKEEQQRQRHREVVNIESVLERLNFVKGVRRLCRYSKPTKKTGTVVIVNSTTTTNTGKAWA